MDQSLLALLGETARALDEQIRILEAQDEDLSAKIGESYVTVLRDLRDYTYERDEELEIRQSLSYQERKLLWVWARLAKLKELRRDVARGVMRHGDWGTSTE
jgi:hypothetical protein